MTNQRGVARGRMTADDLAAVHARMRAAVRQAGGRIDAVYACPHEGGCRCRKPAPGLLLRAARELGLELRHAALVGDRASDMAAAGAVGALRVLVGDAVDPPPLADHAAADLLAATRRLPALPGR